MITGLLWYDPDRRRPLADKVAEAARRYREKFGRDPEVVVVNPAEVEGGLSLRVLGRSFVRPGHFIIGILGREANPAGAEPPSRNGRPGEAVPPGAPRAKGRNTRRRRPETA
jgi:hypothetical protein